MSEIIEAVKSLIPVTSVAGICYTAKHLFTPSLDYLGEEMKNKLMELFNKGKASPQTVIPILEVLPLISDEMLRIMFLNLLETSLNEEKLGLAHPAFPLILKQLCHDEAILILELSKSTLLYENKTWFHTLDYRFKSTVKQCEYEVIEDRDIRIVFLNHLSHLGIVKLKSVSIEYSYAVLSSGLPTERKGDYIVLVGLSDFGKLFAQACIPSTTSNLSNEE